MLEQISEEIIEYFSSELNKKENKDKITRIVLDPCIEYLSKKIRFYLLIVVGLILIFLFISYGMMYRILKKQELYHPFV